MAPKFSSTICFLGALTAAAQSMAAQPNRYVFVFGDSYTATGFNPNGTLPSTSDAFGNPPYPGSIAGVYPNTTFSGGQNWIDYLVKDHLPSGAVVYNLATGGNTVNYTECAGAPPPNDGKIYDLIGQMAELEDLLLVRDVAPERNADNSLYLLWFGINDISIAYNLLGQNKQPQRNGDDVIATDVEQYFALLGNLYSTYGARKILTILVPPIDRSPVYVQNAQTSAFVANKTAYWASVVKSGNPAFQSAHPGVNSLIYDPTNPFNYVLDNYALYGAPNNTCYTCCNGDPKCLWHDFIHASPQEHERMAGDLYSDLQSAGFV